MDDKIDTKTSFKVDSTNRMSRLLIIRRLLGMVSPVRQLMVIAIIFGVFNHLANIALMVWGAYLISSVFIEGPLSITLLDISLLFVLGGIKALSSYVEQNKNHDVAFRLLAHLRTELYRHLEPLTPAKLIDKRSGDLGLAVSSDIELIEVFFAHTISPVSIAAIVSVITLTLLGTWWIILPFVLLPFLILLGIILPLTWDGFLNSCGHQIRSEMVETNAYLTDSLQGFKTILQFNQGEIRRQGISERGSRINHLNQQYASREGLLLGLVGAIVFLADIVMLIVATEGVLAGILSVQGIIIVVIITISSFGPITAVSMVSHHLSQTFAAAERLFNLMDEEPAIIETPDCSSILPHRFDIEFKNVTFSYSPNSSPIIKNFNFQAAQNTIVALLGNSGCGKSTVLKLLLRFWEIESGEITIGGVNIKSICLKDLHSMISVVAPDSHLFDTTIRENIAIGNPSANMDRIIECTKKAQIHCFIMSLPKGYDTSIGELGDKLSGGECQRIIISRALMADTPILLLDEPTSFLDSINENAIQNLVNDLSKERTVILITHRLSSHAQVDRIFLMSEGKCQDILSDNLDDSEQYVSWKHMTS